MGFRSPVIWQPISRASYCVSGIDGFPSAPFIPRIPFRIESIPEQFLQPISTFFGHVTQIEARRLASTAFSGRTFSCPDSLTACAVALIAPAVDT